MLSRSEAIYAKIQSAAGSVNAPAGADAIEIADIPQFNWGEGARFAERGNIHPSSIGRAQPLFGGALAQLTVSVDLKGVSGAGTAPEWGVLARICGLAETDVADTSVTYSPRSSGHELATIDYFQEGVRYRMYDCRGNMTLRATVGEPARLEFVITGRRLADDPIDDSAPSPTFDGGVPPAFVATDILDLSGYKPTFTEFTLDLQNQIAAAVNANAADGFGEVRITGRDPVGTIDPEMTLVATQDWYDHWEQDTTRDIAIAYGSGAGLTIGIDLNQISYTEISTDDREGVRSLGLSFKANESAAKNDEFAIVLT